MMANAASAQFVCETQTSAKVLWENVNRLIVIWLRTGVVTHRFTGMFTLVTGMTVTLILLPVRMTR